MKRVHVLLVLLMLTICWGVQHYFSLPHVVDRVRSSVVRVEAWDKHGGDNYGSGMVVGDGVILTAQHVIDDANNVCIEFDNGTKVKSSTFFRVKSIDAGLIIVDTGDRSGLSFRGDVDVGDTVFTVSSPFGNKNSVGVGILSAHNRDIEGERLHQLDLSVNPGMSGCPAFNRYGGVIGMVTRGKYGLGFIIPSETCGFVVDVYENVQRTKEIN